MILSHLNSRFESSLRSKNLRKLRKRSNTRFLSLKTFDHFIFLRKNTISHFVFDFKSIRPPVWVIARPNFLIFFFNKSADEIRKIHPRAKRLSVSWNTQKPKKTRKKPKIGLFENLGGAKNFSTIFKKKSLQKVENRQKSWKSGQESYFSWKLLNTDTYGFLGGKTEFFTPKMTLTFPKTCQNCSKMLQIP